jgi:hypothetical protein
MIIVTPKRLTAVFALFAALALLYAGPRAVGWQPEPRASFWVLVLTAGAALWYAYLTYRLLRGEQTPVLVIAYEDGRTVVTNFGRGAALNISLANDSGRTLARATDLASGARTTIAATVVWTVKEARYLFYQDVSGRWHGTKCLGQAISTAASIPVANVALGRVFNPPPAVRRAALVRSAVEHWVQLNRSWDPRNWIRRATYWVRKWRAEKRITNRIRAARAEGRLGDTFTPAEVSTATELEPVVADRFLPNHTVGNFAGEREFFVQEPSGRFRLKRHGE